MSPKLDESFVTRSGLVNRAGGTLPARAAPCAGSVALHARAVAAMSRSFVILSSVVILRQQPKDPHRPERGLSIGMMKILRFAQDDNRASLRMTTTPGQQRCFGSVREASSEAYVAAAMTGAPFWVWSTRCSDMAPPPRLTSRLSRSTTTPRARPHDAPAEQGQTMGRSSTFDDAPSLTGPLVPGGTEWPRSARTRYRGSDTCCSSGPCAGRG